MNNPTSSTLKALAALALGLAVTGCNSQLPAPYVLSVPEPQAVSDNLTKEQTPIPALPLQAKPTRNPAELYESGKALIEQGSVEEGINQLMQSAQQGYSGAHYELARLLSEGRVVYQDKQAARIYLQKAVELGNYEAKRVLAWGFLTGEYGAPDTPKGVRMMTEATEGSVRAKRELGMLYANIYKPHLNDTAKALSYLHQAASEGDAQAAYEAGRVHEALGESLEALDWYSKGADLGFKQAKAALQRLQEGKANALPKLAPVQLNLSTTSEPEKPIAALPSGQAMYEKAMALLVKKDRSRAAEARAYALLSLASEAGYSQATTELSMLGGIKASLDALDTTWLETEKTKALNELAAPAQDR